MTSFLDAILENQKDIQDFPNHKSLPGLCRNSVLITENELHALVSFMHVMPDLKEKVTFVFTKMRVFRHCIFKEEEDANE